MKSDQIFMTRIEFGMLKYTSDMSLMTIGQKGTELLALSV